MTLKILNKSDIAKLYSDVSGEYDFWAPAYEKGNLVFKKIDKVDDIVVDYLNSKIPPKAVIFPKMEVLFEYEYEGKDVKIKEREDLDEKRIIFGIRACDSSSLALMANFFGLGDFKDDIYLF
jgi:hypothetical protein